MKKIVLTGAAGRLGSYLREPLTKLADEVLSCDLADDIGKLYDGESYLKVDVANFDEVHKALEGADMVVHFAALVDEGPFMELLGPNFIGSYNIWEAAFQHGVRRVIYASSIHAVGMHKKTDFIGVDVPHRPDTFYGLAKCFTEDLGRMYWDKRGIESVHLRILSCAQVTNARAVGSYLSYDDLVHLVERAVTTPVTEFAVVYGVSNNDRATVDNTKASFLGYRPKDNGEDFAEGILSKEYPMDLNDIGNTHQGGPFASIELGTSPMALMGIVNDKKET